MPWQCVGKTFGVALLLLGAAGCSVSSKGSLPSETNPSPSHSSLPVRVAPPERKTISRTIRQPGSIQAFEQTLIFAKIPGYVEKWCVDRGDEVKRGDLLAELWIPEEASKLKLKEEMVQLSRKSLAMAQAQVATARARITEAEAGLARGEAAHNYWKGQNARFTSLVKESVLDRQTQEETQNQYRAAEAAWKEAQAKVASAQALLQEKESARDKAEVDIRAAEADRQYQADIVAYGRLLAPYDGVVTRRNINTFDFVQPPTGGKGEPLYIVERRDQMRIFVEVPETDAVWVNKGSEARVRLQALQGREFKGEVKRTSYALDQTTRTLLAEIDLPNPRDELRPGMYVFASITAQHKDVLTIPAAAVLTEGEITTGYQSYCFVVESGRVRRTPIEVGARNEQLVEVLKKQEPPARAGEEPRWEPISGEELVVQGELAGLKDGQEVQVPRRP